MARFVENLNQAGLSIKYLSPECLASSFYRVGNLYKSKKVRYHKKQKCCPPIWRGIITAAILLPTCSALLVLLSDRLHSRIAHNGEIIQGAPSPNSPHTKYKGEPPLLQPSPSSYAAGGARLRTPPPIGDLLL